MKYNLKVQNKGWFKKGISSWNKGKSFSEITKQKNSQAHLGKITWNKGLKGKQIAWNKGKKGYLSGVQHYNWKGGITTENYRDRRLFKKQLQHLIFQRDNYQCQICESKKDLQVDHIQSWAEFKELRFDPENCRTLCTRCHYKITFGREMPDNIKAWGHNLGGA